MEEEGLKISELKEIRDPTGEELIPVAVIDSETGKGENGHVKLKNISSKIDVGYDEASQTLIIK